MSTREDQAFTHILSAFPELKAPLSAVGVLSLPSAKQFSVADAVTKTVIGQMLSRHAAGIIYERVEKLSIEKGLSGAWKLSIDELSGLGVSGRKARTITEFGRDYDQDPSAYEAWREMSYEDVVKDVSKHWGLSTWSADILSIFYFGFEDVFPEKDGTLQKAVTLINQRYYGKTKFDQYKASPYKTYLSLYLWAMVDQGVLSETFSDIKI